VLLVEHGQDRSYQLELMLGSVQQKKMDEQDDLDSFHALCRLGCSETCIGGCLSRKSFGALLVKEKEEMMTADRT